MQMSFLVMWDESLMHYRKASSAVGFCTSGTPSVFSRTFHRNRVARSGDFAENSMDLRHQIHLSSKYSINQFQKQLAQYG